MMAENSRRRCADWHKDGDGGDTAGMGGSCSGRDKDRPMPACLPESMNNNGLIRLGTPVLVMAGR